MQCLQKLTFSLRHHNVGVTFTGDVTGAFKQKYADV